MKRAVGPEQKNQRREAILEKAGDFLLHGDFEVVTLTEIARSLSLVKGTLYRYFPTKEALAIEVLERELNLWLQTLEDSLHLLQRPLLPEQLAEILGETLSQRPLLVRLFAIVHVRLEKNLPLGRLIEFKLKAAETLQRAAFTLEATCPALRTKGAEAVLGLYELAIGVGHLTERSPNVEKALKTPGLEIFQLEFKSKLTRSLEYFLRGLA